MDEYRLVDFMPRCLDSFSERERQVIEGIYDPTALPPINDVWLIPEGLESSDVDVPTEWVSKAS